MKKLFFALLSFAMLSISAMAEDTVKPELIDNVYQIASAANMHWLNGHWGDDDFITERDGKTFKLTDDIDLGDWNANFTLSASFDGGGNTITFKSEQKDDADVTGLFRGVSDGVTISDLIVNADITTNNNTRQIGVLCCSIYSDNSLEEQVMVTISRVVTKGKITGANKVAGGIIGNVSCSLLLKDAVNYATVESGVLAGGLIGYIVGSNEVRIHRSGNAGVIKIKDLSDDASTSVTAAGFIGEVMRGGSTSEILLSNCFNRGSICSVHKDGLTLSSVSLKYYVGKIGRDVAFINTYCYLGGEVEDEDITSAGVYVQGEKKTQDVSDFSFASDYFQIPRYGANYLYYQGYEESYASAFHSGEITYYLNSGVETDKAVWRQGDGYPILAIEGEGAIVYKHGDTYSTTPHTYTDGVCDQSTTCLEKPELKGSVYYIKNAANMHWLNNNWNDTAFSNYLEGKTFLLEKDINLGKWDSNISLFNDFNGGKHKISFESEPTSEWSPSTGLFSQVFEGVTINDLTIDATITTNQYTSQIGILCNSISSYSMEPKMVCLARIVTKGSISGPNKVAGGVVGTVSCSVQTRDVVNYAKVESAQLAGGVFGRISSGAKTLTIERTGNAGEIKMVDLSNSDYKYPTAGGLLGDIANGENSDTLFFTDCFSRGSIYSTLKEGGTEPETVMLNMFIGCTMDRDVKFINTCRYFTGIYTLGEKKTYGILDYATTGDPTITYKGHNYVYYQDVEQEPRDLETIGQSHVEEAIYNLNSGNETEKALWRLGNWYPVLSFEGGDIIYKHSNVYNTTSHNFENGVCSNGGEGVICYEAAVKDEAKGYIVSNAGQLMWLNENWCTSQVSKDCDIHFGTPVTEGSNPAITDFNPVTIDLGDVANWVSNISVSRSVYGHGSSVKFKSQYDATDEKYRGVASATGLFSTIISTEGTDSLVVEDLNIYGMIYETNVEKTTNSKGFLANELVTAGSDISIRNVKVYNYNEVDKGITSLSPSIGGLIGSATYSSVRKNLKLTNVVSYVDINGTVYMGGLVGSSDLSNVDVTYSAYNGKMMYVENEKVTDRRAMGSILGCGDFRIKYCYTTAPMINEKVKGLYMGTFIGYYTGDWDWLSVEKSYAYYGDVTNWSNYDREPRNLDSEGGVILPICVSGNTESDQNGVAKPTYESSAKEVSVIDFDDNIYYYYPSIDRYREDEMKKMFLSGRVVGNIHHNLSNVMDKFSQNLGEYGKEYLEYYPHLVCENDSYLDIVYPSCTEGFYTNDNVEIRDNGNYVSSDHSFDEQFHVCKFCKAVDTNYFDDNNEVIIETTDNLTDMTDNVSALTEAGLKPEITVTTDIVYEDVDYTELTVSELEELLPAKESIGTEEKPFNGKFDGEGGDFVNFAFQQNGLFNYVGSEGEVTDLNIVNGVILNDLTGADVVKDEAEDVTYAAALVNVNNGKIEYSSFVGAMATPAGAGEVVNCLVGQNNGTVAYSFAYFTDLETVKNSLNKAAIIVKGNTGVGRGAGKTTKVAANTEQKAEVEDDPYYKPADAILNSDERIFSNEEFASGVVAYWLNFEEEGYSGKYTCKYRQGTLTPELSENGEDAVHKIVYQSNKSTATVTGKAFANSKSTLTIDLSEAATSVKIGSEEATLTNDNTRATIEVPETEEADITVVVTFAGATGIETITPEAKANVMVVDGRLMVFGAEEQDVTVYNINGSVVYSSVVNSNKVDLPVIARGIYFVKVGTTTTKIVF